MNRRGFLKSMLAGAVLGAVASTGLGRTTLQVVQQRGALLDGEIGSFESFRYVENGGYMFSEEFARELRETMEARQIEPDPDGSYVAFVHFNAYDALRAFTG